MGASPIDLAVVTAADRAAATCQRWASAKLQGKRTEGVAGAIGKPPPRLVRGETLTCGGFAATLSLLPQKEGNHPRQRMVEDILTRRSNALPSKRAYPQSAYRKGGVFNLRLNTPVAKATSLFRKRNSEPLTAPSAEGAFWRRFLQSLP